MTNEEWAWLAGFVDGEGFVGLTHQIKKETKHCAASPRYHPYLIITNTDLTAILYKRLLALNKKGQRYDSSTS